MLNSNCETNSVTLLHQNNQIGCRENLVPESQFYRRYLPPKISFISQDASLAFSSANNLSRNSSIWQLLKHKSSTMQTFQPNTIFSSKCFDRIVPKNWTSMTEGGRLQTWIYNSATLMCFTCSSRSATTKLMGWFN